MRSRKYMALITNGIDATIRALSNLAFIAICLMCLVVLANVIGRYFFKSPFLGTIEIVELAMVIIASIAIPFAALQRRHIRVDLLISLLPKRARATAIGLGLLLSTAIFAIITYQSVVVAVSYVVKTGQISDVLSIPYAPLRCALALGMLLLALELLVDAAKTILGKDRERI